MMAEDEAHAWDDNTGGELDPNMVQAARMEEMDEVYKHEVHTKVPIKDCWDATGKKPVAVR